MGVFFIIRFQILDQFKPIIIFSAHAHLSRVLTYPPQEVNSVYDNRIVKVQLHSVGMADSTKYTEIMIPTSSYRMGVRNIGFGFAVIGKYFLYLSFVHSPSISKIALGLSDFLASVQVQRLFAVDCRTNCEQKTNDKFIDFVFSFRHRWPHSIYTLIHSKISSAKTIDICQ